MRESAVINWVDSELNSLLSNSSLVDLSSPDDHTGLTESRHPPIYPFVGIQKIASTPESAGLGSGEVYVEDTSYNSDGVIESITYGKDVTLRIEVIPTTDGDGKLRDDLGEDVADHFSLLARQGKHPEDIDEIRVYESAPNGRTDEFVRGEGVPIEIDYGRYTADTDVQAATTANLDVDVRGADAFEGSTQ